MRHAGACRAHYAGCAGVRAPATMQPPIPPLDAPIAIAGTSDWRSPQPRSMSGASRSLTPPASSPRQPPVVRRRDRQRADGDARRGRRRIRKTVGGMFSRRLVVYSRCLPRVEQRRSGNAHCANRRYVVIN
jgi:hypothetical protein